MTAAFRFANWPLRAKMAALLIAASLLPLAIWAAIDLRNDRTRLLDGVKGLLEARGDQIVHELDGFHRGHRRSVDQLARFPESAAHCAEAPERRATRQAAMIGLLSAYPASDPGIRGAALLDGSGRVVVATEAPLTGVDISDRPVVRAALQGRAIVSDPFVSSPRSGSVPTIAYMTPIFGPERQVVCVAVLWVRAAALWNTVKASDALAGANSSAVLFDREGIRIVLDVKPYTAAAPGAEHEAAVRRADGVFNRWFLDPIFKGRYPEDITADYAAVMPPVEAGDMALISQSIDHLGINYYTRGHVLHAPGLRYPHAAEQRVPGAHYSTMEWEDFPEGLRLMLTRLHREYAPRAIYVAENGAAEPDAVDADGRCRDTARVNYLAGHLAACAQAIAEGAPLDAYLAWSFMDNFEWGRGYTQRFGLVHVDYATQRRTAKDSALALRDFIAAHRR